MQQLSNNGSRPRCVAFVHDSYVYGGMEVQMLLLLRHLDPARYTPVVLVPGYSEPYHSSPAQFIEEVQSLGMPLLRPPHPGHMPGVSFMNDVANARRLLKANRVDVVHIHSSHPLGARKATLAARLAGVPVVVRTEHLPPSAFGVKPFAAYAVKPFDWLTDRIVTVSETDRDEQIRVLGRDPKKVYRSYNGIQTQRFDPAHDNSAAKQRLGLDPALPLVGAVGRLTRQKGYTYLVDAAAQVIQSYGPVNFTLVGRGPLEQQLREQVARLALDEYFHFAGYQPDPIPYVKAMDIAVMSSLFEGFSLTLLEYMALGKPLVVTNYPSLVEAIDG